MRSLIIARSCCAWTLALVLAIGGAVAPAGAAYAGEMPAEAPTSSSAARLGNCSGTSDVADWAQDDSGVVAVDANLERQSATDVLVATPEDASPTAAANTAETKEGLAADKSAAGGADTVLVDPSSDAVVEVRETTSGEDSVDPPMVEVELPDVTAADEAPLTLMAEEVSATGRRSVTITSVKQSGSKLKVSWKASGGAKKYLLYRSAKRKSGYKKIKTLTKKSFSDKVKANTAYWYKVVAVYAGNKKVTSKPVSGKVTKKQDAKKVIEAKRAATKANWFADTYSYVAGDRICVVAKERNNRRLVISTFNKKMRLLKTKVVTTPKSAVWGGFYHGADGYNYVLYGYSNPELSSTKVVYQLVRYSSAWKRLKAADLKAETSRVNAPVLNYDQTDEPRFVQKGDTMLLFIKAGCGEPVGEATPQTLVPLMRALVCYYVNTSTMTGHYSDVSVPSLSTDAMYPMVDGSDLYFVVDPRFQPNIEVRKSTMARATTTYGMGDSFADEAWTNLAIAFGGDDLSGSKLCGAVQDGDNILSCGYSRPGPYKVKGVTGSQDEKGNFYTTNLFVAITNKHTGKTKRKWLTTNNPKTSRINVEAAHMVKVANDRYGILYSTYNSKKVKEQLYYTVIDSNGNVVQSRTVKNAAFGDDPGPLTKFGSYVYWTHYDSYSRNSCTELYRIPAL